MEEMENEASDEIVSRPKKVSWGLSLLHLISIPFFIVTFIGVLVLTPALSLVTSFDELLIYLIVFTFVMLCFIIGRGLQLFVQAVEYREVVGVQRKQNLLVNCCLTLGVECCFLMSFYFVKGFVFQCVFFFVRRDVSAVPLVLCILAMSSSAVIAFYYLRSLRGRQASSLSGV